MRLEDIQNWKTLNGRLIGQRCRMLGFNLEIMAVPALPVEHGQLIGFVVYGGLEDDLHAFSLSWDADSFELIDETQEVKKSGCFALTDAARAKLSDLLTRLRALPAAEVEIAHASRLLDENLDITTLTREDLDLLYRELQELRPIDDEIFAGLSELMASTQHKEIFASMPEPGDTRFSKTHIVPTVMCDWPVSYVETSKQPADRIAQRIKELEHTAPPQGLAMLKRLQDAVPPAHKGECSVAVQFMSPVDYEFQLEFQGVWVTTFNHGSGRLTPNVPLVRQMNPDWIDDVIEITDALNAVLRATEEP